MLEASVEEIGLEEEGCHTVETEQERLDRDGIYGEIKRELIKRGIPAHEKEERPKPCDTNSLPSGKTGKLSEPSGAPGSQAQAVPVNMPARPG
jgi:hypothetical protein